MASCILRLFTLPGGPVFGAPGHLVGQSPIVPRGLSLSRYIPGALQKKKTRLVAGVFLLLLGSPPCWCLGIVAGCHSQFAFFGATSFVVPVVPIQAVNEASVTLGAAANPLALIVL